MKRASGPCPQRLPFAGEAPGPAVLRHGISWLYGVFMAVTLAICLWFPGRIEYLRAAFSRVFLPAGLLLLMGLAVCALLFILSERLGRLIRHRRAALLCASLLLLAVQVLAVWQYYFFTDWDVQGLLDLSYLVSRGYDTSEYAAYFSRYPNNLLLGWLFSVVRSAALKAGLARFEYGILLLIQCLLNTATGALLALLLHELRRDPTLTIFGYALYVLLVGLSPWVSIPYSDSMALLFPCLIAWLAFRRIREGSGRAALRWGLIGVCACIGYHIKPQVLILLMAILIVGLLRQRRRTLRLGLSSLGGLAAGFLCASLLCGVLVNSLPLERDADAEFGPAHFLMMGLNTETMGVYLKEDVEYSASFPNREQRDRADLERAMERLRDMGGAGFLRLMVQKTLTNYADGTFCWDGEGEFYVSRIEREPTPLGDFLRELYDSGDWGGRYFPVWANAAHMLWLAVLLLSCFSGLAGQDARRDCLMLGILGLSLFELLFEARARYLYTYVPLYITLAAYGADALRRKLRRA